MASLLPAKRKLFVQKWAGFVSALWLTTFSGYFTFPAYSTALKEVLGINQKLLNGLSNAIPLGDACGGIVAGNLSNFLPVWALFCISASAGFLGYGVQWLAVSERVSTPPYWLMFIAAMTGGSAGCVLTVALLNASVRNFQQNSGPVVGLFKACMGLSSAVFVAPSFSARFLLWRHKRTKRLSRQVFKSSALWPVVLLSIAALTLLPTDSFKETSVYRIISMGLLITIVGAPALVPITLLSKVKETEGSDHEQEEIGRSCEELELDLDDNSLVSCVGDNFPYPLVIDQAVSEDLGKKGLRRPLLDNVSGIFLQKRSDRKLAQWLCCERSPSWGRVEDLGKDTPTLVLFKTWHYYVLYFALFTGGGLVATFMNNLGQVGQSLGFSNTNLLAALFSLGSFSGRLASGNVSEYFARKTNMPRPAWMALTKLPTPFLYLWLSTGSPTSLYVGSPMLGFCLGSLVTLSVPIISEFYGLKHFSTNFALTNTYFVTGSFAFSTLAGYLYDREAPKGEGSNSVTCYGAKCYGMTFQIMACFAALGLACDAVLTVYSKPFYQKLKA
ncbi:hypothetical protein L7F22_052278 [Adiantum nelumboides]|nr:hypothetical protein [Adiantum nelumboides]